MPSIGLVVWRCIVWRGMVLMRFCRLVSWGIRMSSLLCGLVWMPYRNLEGMYSSAITEHEFMNSHDVMRWIGYAYHNTAKLKKDLNYIVAR